MREPTTTMTLTSTIPNGYCRVGRFCDPDAPIRSMDDALIVDGDAFVLTDGADCQIRWPSGHTDRVTIKVTKLPGISAAYAWAMVNGQMLPVRLLQTDIEVRLTVGDAA